MRKFHYNDRILELIKGKSTVISSGLGTGKTQSVKQYVSTTTTRTLVVVNDTDSQEDLLKGVEEYCVVYNYKNDVSFKQATESILRGKIKTLIATKAKFNMLLTTDSCALNMFERVILDEASGLNPIQMSSIDNSIADVCSVLEAFVVSCGEEMFNRYVKLISYIKDLYDNLKEGETSQFYMETVDECKMKYAEELYLELKKLYDKDLLHNKSQNIIPVFNLLDAIRSNNLYLGEYLKKGKRVINFLYVNTFLRERIEKVTAKFIILDATANLNKYLYEYLGIKIEYLEKKQYPNLKFHIHKYKNLTDALGRASEEATLKIAEDIKSTHRQDYLTFCIKNKKDLLLKEGFSMVDYAFSGRDIGSNAYRDETEINIVFGQTHPIHYRALYNSVILGIEPKQASNPVELRKTETRLMSERLIQLVGRTAIRQDNEAHVNVHFYCVDYNKIERTQEFFGIENENVILYDSRDIGMPKKKVTIEDVLYHIQKDLGFKFKGYEVNLRELIRNRLYSPETSGNTIKGWYTKKEYRDQIETLAKKCGCEVITKKGRYGGVFIRAL